MALLKILWCFKKADPDAKKPRSPVDFDHKAKQDDERTMPGLSSSQTFTIAVPEDLKQRGPNCLPPPEYSLTTLSESAQRMLSVYQSGSTLGDEYGITNAFNTLRHRHVKVWIDDNHKVPSVTKKSIEAIVIEFHLLGRALHCDMEFYFTSQSNTDSKQLTNEERERARALEELWNTQSLGDAKALINGSQILQEMGLMDWLRKNLPADTHTRSAATKHATTVETPKHATTVETPKHATTVETPNETFIRLLRHVRDLKLPLWQGYYQRDISLTDLMEAYKSAVNKSRKQPKSLNSVCFTYQREIGHYIRVRDKEQADPTTVLILTGSPLQPSEKDSIINLQKTSAIKKTKELRGQGIEFSIQVIAMIQHMDISAVNCFRKIDSAFDDDDDISDLIEVDETRLLQKGPSPLFFLKAFNSHYERVDNMHFRKEADKYGKMDRFKPGEALTMPGFKDVAKILGQDDGDSDDE